MELWTCRHRRRLPPPEIFRQIATVRAFLTDPTRNPARTRLLRPRAKASLSLTPCFSGVAGDHRTIINRFNGFLAAFPFPGSRSSSHRVAHSFLFFLSHSASKQNEVVTYGTFDTFYLETTFSGKNTHSDQCSQGFHENHKNTENVFCRKNSKYIFLAPIF